MKKVIYVISVIAVILITACEKHVLTYETTELNSATTAQVRIVYDVPLSGSAHSLTRLLLNDKLVSDVTTALGGIYPNSSAKYFAVNQGTVKMDAFTGTTKDVLKYTNTFNVSAGKKYSVFIHDLAQPPYVLEDPDVFPAADPWKDTVAFVQFVNLLYKADGVTPYGKLFLKGRRGAGTVASPYVYFDIAQSDFKQSSAFIPYKLVKPSVAGTESAMAFVLLNEDGTMLQHFPSSSGALTNYAATGYSLTKARVYIFHLNGKLGTNYAGQIIRLSTYGLN